MSVLPPELIGALLGIGAAVSLSVAALAVRRGSSAKGGSSFDALLVVLLMNVVILAPAALIIYYPTYGITVRSLLAFAAAGIIATGFGRMAYYTSIALVGASRAEPVKSSMPLYATIFAVLLLGEAVSSIRWVGILIIILGVGVISWDLSMHGQSGPRNVSITGFFLGVAAAILFGFEPVLAKIGFSEGTPSIVGLLIKTISAAVFFFAYAALKGEFELRHLHRSDQRLWYVLAGLGNTSFLVMYYLGLSIAPVSIITPLIQTSPLFVAALSYLFLSDLERITKYVVIGVILVATGAILITIVG